ncbi:hypothetical protein P8452_15414 [Trifolium repens]|nr:hypothetical protein P8452_15414 [Trifolium repens]
MKDREITSSPSSNPCRGSRPPSFRSWFYSFLSVRVLFLGDRRRWVVVAVWVLADSGRPPSRRLVRLFLFSVTTASSLVVAVVPLVAAITLSQRRLGYNSNKVFMM